MKVLMKSGEKKIKFGHRAIYELKEEKGLELFELVEDMQKMKITSMDTLVYAELKKDYDSIGDMLDDMIEEQFNNYIGVIGEAVGKLFGESSETK